MRGNDTKRNGIDVLEEDRKLLGQGQSDGTLRSKETREHNMGQMIDILQH